MGEALQLDLSRAIAIAEDKISAQIRALLDRDDKKVEIGVHRRKLAAEKKNLEELLHVNRKIRDAHILKMPWSGNVTYATFSGAFVERGDVICFIDRIQQP